MKGSKIWGAGKHHLYINKKPTWVYVSPEAARKDYKILKANLPIPIGIDHLDPEIIQANKILEKMDPLNVGTINDVELKDDGIHILEAEISNPAIQQLYKDKKLPSWSIVSKASLKECQSGKADYIENYSIIDRVDFVEKGACTTCNLNYEDNDDLIYAKSVIGEIMADNNENNNENNNPTLEDVVKAITDFKKEVNDKIEKIDERIKAVEEPSEENNDDEGSENNAENDANAKNPELEKLQKDIAKMKAEAADMEAKNTVKSYIDEGKILPKDIENHVSLAATNPEQYKVMMDDAPVLIEHLGERLSTQEAGGTNPDDGNLSKYEQDNDINIEEMIAEEANENK